MVVGQAVVSCAFTLQLGARTGRCVDVGVNKIELQSFDELVKPGRKEGAEDGCNPIDPVVVRELPSDHRRLVSMSVMFSWRRPTPLKTTTLETGMSEDQAASKAAASPACDARRNGQKTGSGLTPKDLAGLRLPPV